MIFIRLIDLTLRQSTNPLYSLKTDAGEFEFSAHSGSSKKSLN